METIIIIILIGIISFWVFKVIKKVCNPIKNITAIILVVPTVATCGIALLIFKILRSSFVMGGSYNSTTNSSSASYIDIPSFDEPKKKEKKKVAKSMDNGFGKTTYYDDEGNIMGSSMDNGFGKSTYYDDEGNYAGEELDSGLGHTVYTDKDCNTISSTKDYRGDKTYSDGTRESSDSSGNKYYS